MTEISKNFVNLNKIYYIIIGHPVKVVQNRWPEDINLKHFIITPVFTVHSIQYQSIYMYKKESVSLKRLLIYKTLFIDKCH